MRRLSSSSLIRHLRRQPSRTRVPCVLPTFMHRCGLSEHNESHLPANQGRDNRRPSQDLIIVWAAFETDDPIRLGTFAVICGSITPSANRAKCMFSAVIAGPWNAEISNRNSRTLSHLSHLVTKRSIGVPSRSRSICIFFRKLPPQEQGFRPMYQDSWAKSWTFTISSGTASSFATRREPNTKLNGPKSPGPELRREPFP